MKNIIPALIIFLTAAVWAGESNLIKSGDGENEITVKQWGKYVTQNKEDVVWGKGALQLSRRATIKSPEMVPVDPQKKYCLKMFVKTLQQPAKVLIGLKFYTKDKEEIGTCSVYALPDRKAVLNKDVKAGEKTIEISATDWEAKKIPAVAFNVKEDLSDLPNLEAFRITEIQKKDNHSILTLRKPLKKAYPAGTLLRQHIYLDPLWFEFKAGTEWQEFSFDISKESPLGKPDRKKFKNIQKFWYGTRFVKIIILTNMGCPKADKDYTTFLLDDISFKEITKGVTK